MLNCFSSIADLQYIRSSKIHWRTLLKASLIPNFDTLYNIKNEVFLTVSANSRKTSFFWSAVSGDKGLIFGLEVTNYH